MDGNELSHAHAGSRNEYWNNFNLNVSSVMPAILKELLTSINNRSYRCGSFVGIPLKWPIVWSTWSITSFNSNYGASISDLLIPGFNSFRHDTTYCLMARSISLAIRIGLWALTTPFSWTSFWFSNSISAVCLWANLSCLFCLNSYSISRSTGSKSMIESMLMKIWKENHKNKE